MDETTGDGDEAAKRRRRVRWTGKMRETFLDHLAATCNVRAAAAAAGITPISVYVLRRRDPAFVAAWGEALALGYEMLETLLVGHALAGGAGGGTPLDAPIGAINVDLALQLMTTHRNAAAKPHRGGPTRRFATPEETDKAIMKRLAAIEARRARGA